MRHVSRVIYERDIPNIYNWMNISANRTYKLRKEDKKIQLFSFFYANYDEKKQGDGF